MAITINTRRSMFPPVDPSKPPPPFNWKFWKWRRPRPAASIAESETGESPPLQPRQYEESSDNRSLLISLAILLMALLLGALIWWAWWQSRESAPALPQPKVEVPAKAVVPIPPKTVPPQTEATLVEPKPAAKVVKKKAVRARTTASQPTSLPAYTPFIAPFDRTYSAAVVDAVEGAFMECTRRNRTKKSIETCTERRSVSFLPAGSSLVFVPR